MRQELRKQGRKIGRRRVARLMRQARLVGRCRKRRQPRTTDSRHGGPIAANLLREKPVLTRIDQIWVTDITYIPTEEGFLYVAALLDLHSRRIVGWACGDNLETTLCTKALKSALRHRRPSAELIHHSDRGVQYASLEYRESLVKAGLTRSMSRKGNCYDNAFIESFWSTLKTECTARQTFATRADAEFAIFDYIETFYNPIRLHSSLDYHSPRDFENAPPEPTTSSKQASK